MAQSPDLNIVKCVRDYMTKQKHLSKSTSEDQLLVIQDVWNNLSSFKNCPNVRTDAAFKAKGIHTKYCFDVDFSSVHLKHFVNTIILKAFLVNSIFSCS